MPSGKTHDKISWYFFIPFSFIVWYLTREWMLVVLFAFAYLFSSFMFGGDLDLVSVQSKRWGIFRWIWIPYRKFIPHRSSLSHGMVVGTTFRLFYLGFFIALFYGICYLLTEKYFPVENKELVKTTYHGYIYIKNQPPTYFASIFAGLVTGAGLHTISDLTVSKVKRIFKPKKKRFRK